jgi:hypothetical protein
MFAVMANEGPNWQLEKPIETDLTSLWAMSPIGLPTKGFGAAAGSPRPFGDEAWNMMTIHEEHASSVESFPGSPLDPIFMPGQHQQGRPTSSDAVPVVAVEPASNPNPSSQLPPVTIQSDDGMDVCAPPAAESANRALSVDSVHNQLEESCSSSSSNNNNIVAARPFESAEEDNKASPAMEDSAENKDNTCGLRRGLRVRRPPTYKQHENDATEAAATIRPSRTASRRHPTAVVTAAAAAAGVHAGKSSNTSARRGCQTIVGGGVRRRPSGAMSVEDRILAIFGEDTLRLDRDSFKMWRAATDLPTLTHTEQTVLKRLRRRLLGRTYAKRSRDRQMAFASSVEDQCEELRKENAFIRRKIARLAKILGEPVPI